MQSSSAALRNKLKLRQLALLAELEQAGTLHKAADRLGMSQPAATRLIHELEELMGASLFERTSRGMAPTDMGRLLIRHAAMVLAGIDHVYQEAVALRSGNAGILRAGLFPGVPPRLVAAAITQVKRESPRMDVQLVEGANDRLLAALREGDLNIVVGRAPAGEDSQAFAFELLFTEYFSVVCAANGEPPATADLAALVDHPWVLPSPGSALRSSLDVQFLSRCGRLPPNLIEASVSPTVVALLNAGNYLAVMPSLQARDYAAGRQLRIVIPRLAHLAGPIGTITRAGEAQSSQALRLVEALRAASEPLNHAAGDPETGSPLPKV
ncbi:MAG TPA: LysR substrate-binding domain-containing protein [Ramlibacter sp.]|nr:LysR substrate-binding domain-containing protein [Ramlibacter sp.]